MAKYDFDLFTIGAGSGGVAGSRRAASYGVRVGIAENSRVGGTCVMRGCVPKKLLVYGAQFADAFEDARGFGWDVTPPRFDWPTLIANKNKELDRLEGIYRSLLKDCARVIEARGVLVDAHTVAVGGKRVTAEHIIVATGGAPGDAGRSPASSMSSPRTRRSTCRSCRAASSSSAAAISRSNSPASSGARRRGDDDHPRRGGAQRLRRRCPCRYRQGDAPRGIDHPRADRTRAHRQDRGGFTAHTKAGEEISADLVMYATGRRPNTRGIGPRGGRREAAMPMGACIVDEWSRTSVPNIYAIGDVTDRLNLTPVAIAEGRAIAETLYNNNPMKIDHANVPTAVFSQPPVGTVGLERARGARAHGDSRHLSRPLPADEEHAVGPRGADDDEAGRRPADATGCSASTWSAPTRRRSCRASASRSNAARPSGSSTRPSASTRPPPRSSSRCARKCPSRRRKRRSNCRLSAMPS